MGSLPPPTHSWTLSLPGLVPLLWPWPWAWHPFGQQQQRSPERPLEVSLLNGGPGSWLVGSPCWPEATWVPRCSAQPHSLGPHTPQLEQSLLTTGGGGQQTAKVTNKGLKKHQKVCRGGRAFRGSGGKGRVASGSLLGRWLQGPGIRKSGWSPVSALFPAKVTRCIQASAPLGRMHRKGQFMAWLNTMVDYKRLQTRTTLSGSHVPPHP